MYDGSVQHTTVLLFPQRSLAMNFVTHSIHTEGASTILQHRIAKVNISTRYMSLCKAKIAQMCTSITKVVKCSVNSAERTKALAINANKRVSRSSSSEMCRWQQASARAAP
ncbi:hypothetical protein TRVL_05398 [Trypanosoma vivax]|nr:hypothetical protein TRVL_05398 [Trypanosoma vivax]